MGCWDWWWSRWDRRGWSSGSLGSQVRLEQSWRYTRRGRTFHTQGSCSAARPHHASYIQNRCGCLRAKTGKNHHLLYFLIKASNYFFLHLYLHQEILYKRNTIFLKSEDNYSPTWPLLQTYLICILDRQISLLGPQPERCREGGKLRNTDPHTAAAHLSSHTPATNNTTYFKRLNTLRGI